MQKALFLDRDGIILLPINNEAPQNPNDLHIIPEIKPVIKSAKKHGYLTIIISNQPDVALGKIDEQTLKSLDIRFHQLLKEQNISLDAIFYCYHHKDGINSKYTIICDCRKPKPGLLLKAANQYNIDLSASFILGDRASDIKAGKNARVQTILYDALKPQDKYLLELNIKPDYYINSLSEAIDIICKP